MDWIEKAKHGLEYTIEPLRSMRTSRKNKLDFTNVVKARGLNDWIASVGSVYRNLIIYGLANIVRYAATGEFIADSINPISDLKNVFVLCEGLVEDMIVDLRAYHNKSQTLAYVKKTISTLE